MTKASASLVERLAGTVEAAGLVGPGFAGASAFPTVRQDLEEARRSGRSGSLTFTFGDPERSSDPTVSFPWARSTVTVAAPYLPVAGSPGPARPGTGVVARFATQDHYAPLRAVLNTLAGLLRDDGHRAEIVCDDNRMVDRAAAVRSGLAWWGKSSMALMPGAGPWTLLGSVVTEAELPLSEPMVRDCGTCDACIPACPTGAIVAPGVVDARRCLAAVLQSPGPIPIELREPMADRFYGCDDCLVACPPGDRLLARSTGTEGRIDLIDVVRTADRPLRSRFEHFYVPRNAPRHLRRNAIVALGNGRDSNHALLLAGLLGHPDPMLRSHAAWSLGRLGGGIARAVLDARRVDEGDPGVATEIELALGTLA